MKKFFKNNKGFTLVELIIVIAVIAVLAAVAAPQYIKYVERSRQGMDASMLQEVKHIVEIEAATTEEIEESTFTITIKNDKSVELEGTESFAGPSSGTGTTAVTATDAFTNVNTTCGTLKAKSAKSAGSYVLNISDAGVVTWDDEDAITTLQNGAKS